jgi:hypothetical protein
MVRFRHPAPRSGEPKIREKGWLKLTMKQPSPVSLIAEELPNAALWHKGHAFVQTSAPDCPLAIFTNNAPSLGGRNERRNRTAAN